MQRERMAFMHSSLNEADQPVDVHGRGGACIDDEIGVQGGDLSAANPRSLEAKVFDQLTGLQGVQGCETRCRSWVWCRAECWFAC